MEIILFFTTITQKRLSRRLSNNRLMLSAALAGFLGIKYRLELAKQKKTKELIKLIPHISAFQYPPAKVGEQYRAEIIASLGETHADLEMTVAGLPEGMVLAECSQEFDSPILSAPNTLEKCFITGAPAEAGLYPLTITATADKYNFTKITVELAVEQP